jgi:hypothetical protein
MGFERSTSPGPTSANAARTARTRMAPLDRNLRVTEVEGEDPRDE